MANLTTLSNSLRSELGDTASSFLQNYLSDGTTKKFHLDYYPVSGTSLIVMAGNTNISSTVTIEEATGILTLPTAQPAGTILSVSGMHYRYFTDAEIQNYINIAFLQHSVRAVNAYGSKITLANLPAVEEYPVLILASTLALFTLATDASYDIDIQAPDGVSIPRSERYRQLMGMVDARKEQYRELCGLLNVGLHRVEISTLRRISQRTNRYVPIYLPQELDDGGYPKRVHIPLPTYMDQTKSTVPTYDINLHRGDSFTVDIDFPFALTDYSLLSQIRSYSGATLVLATFNIAVTDYANGKATLSLTSDQTSNLPSRGLWDIQMTKKAIRVLNSTTSIAVSSGHKGTFVKTGYVTYTTSSAHGFTTGSQVTIENVITLDKSGNKTTSNGYNGTFNNIVVFDNTSFYVENSTTTSVFSTNGWDIKDPDTNITLSKIPTATAYYIDPTYEHTYLKGAVIVEEQVTNENHDPYAPGWQG